MNEQGALQGLRVLDMTNSPVQYAGKLLAGLGATVVLVEPPGGAATRTFRPFNHLPGTDRSIPFWEWNTGKQSITLQLADHEGQRLFHELARRFDIVVHDMSPARAEAAGLSAELLEQINPALIQCAVTGFGGWGPHSQYAWTDITVAAMSGLVWLLGSPDRAPTIPAGEPASICGALHAVQGILAAVLVREVDGRGEIIDVSQQEAMSMAQEFAMMTWDMRQERLDRTGGRRERVGVGVYECSDGFIYCNNAITPQGRRDLIAWLDDEGEARDLATEVWRQWTRTPRPDRSDSAAWAAYGHKFAHVEEIVSSFFRKRRKNELQKVGQQRGLMIGVVSTARDIVENEHLEERSWWAWVQPEGVTQKLPFAGPPYRMSRTPVRVLRPPSLGEHTRAVFEDELGLSDRELSRLQSAGVI